MSDDDIRCNLLCERLPSLGGAILALEEALEGEELVDAVEALESIANIAHATAEGLLLSAVEVVSGPEDAN